MVTGQALILGLLDQAAWWDDTAAAEVHLQADNMVTAAPEWTSKAASGYPCVVCVKELMHNLVLGDALTWCCLSSAKGVKAAEDAARRGSRYPAEHVALSGTVLINIMGQLSGQVEG